MTRLFSTLLRASLALSSLWCVAGAAPASAQACTSTCLASGDYTYTMTWAGQPRTYQVHVPASYTGQRPVALALDLHGHGLTSDNQRGQSGQLQQSDALGFIAVWPQGIGNSWNGEGCCTVAYQNNIDDVGFLRAVIADIRRRAWIDPDKLYVTGWSNGGGMAQRMACEASDVVRAIAPVAHPLNTDSCRPTHVVDVLTFHGKQDQIIPYDGSGLPVLPNPILGLPTGWQGARESLAAWKLILGCTDTLSKEPVNRNSTDWTYRDCAGGGTVGLVTVPDADHNLYTAPLPLLPTDHVEVAAYIWSHVFRP